MSDLSDWINTELNRRRWSQEQLAREASISSGYISLILSEQRHAGVEFCTAVARAFRVPPDTVFRFAGLLPSLPDDKNQEQQLLDYYRALDATSQRALMTLARALHEQRPEYTMDKDKDETP